MVALHIGDHALEHGLGMAIGSDSQVFLTEVLCLRGDRNGFLQKGELLSVLSRSNKDVAGVQVARQGEPS